MTNQERIRVKIVAGPTEATVHTIEGAILNTVAHYRKLGDGTMPDRIKFSEETRQAMKDLAYKAMQEAEDLEKRLNAPPEPPAPTLREAAEELLRLSYHAQIGEYHTVRDDAITKLRQALDAEKDMQA